MEFVEVQLPAQTSRIELTHRPAESVNEAINYRFTVTMMRYPL
jgi:hypothetical protein